MIGGGHNNIGAEAGKSVGLEHVPHPRALPQGELTTCHPFTHKSATGQAAPRKAQDPPAPAQGQVQWRVAPTPVPVKVILPLLTQGILSPGRQREPPKGDIGAKACAWDKELPMPFWRSLWGAVTLYLLVLIQLTSRKPESLQGLTGPSFLIYRIANSDLKPQWGISKLPSEGSLRSHPCNHWARES